MTEVEKLLDAVHDWQSEEGTTEASMLTVVLEAHVLATVELARQARVANLIAYKQLHTGREMREDQRGWHLDALDVSRDDLTDAIEAELGLS